MTIFILTTPNPTRRHVKVNGKFHCYVSLASVARLARYAIANGWRVVGA